MDDELRGLLARYARGELSADDARRAILRYPKWRVAEIDGELETVALDDGTPMLIAESSASDGREYSGLELVRDIAPLVGGLSFDPDEPWGSAFRPGALPELQNWARTVELEDAVAKPGPGQRDLLYEGPWWVAVSPGTGRPAVHRADGLDVITIMTAPDAAATFRRTERHRGLDVVRLGPALWGDLAKRSDFDGVRLNPLRPLAQLWPPHVPAMLVAGCDPRPNAEPLPARTVAEIHLWLDQHGARQEKRELSNRATPVGEVTVARAWRNYDRREIAFTRVAPASDTEGLGSVPSRILCAGKLRQSIQSKLAGLPRLTWRADAWHRQRAALAVGWALELEKLVCGERVPFAALRTPEGAHLWHLEPQAFTARAIRKLRDRAASFR